MEMCKCFQNNQLAVCKVFRLAEARLSKLKQKIIEKLTLRNVAY